MPASQLYIESRKVPFVRLLIALIAGILLQWYFAFSLFAFIAVFAFGLLAYTSFFFLPAYKRFTLQAFQGISILVMMSACGGMLSYTKNPLHQPGNYTKVYRAGDAVVATVTEALLNKPKTAKATVAITGLYRNKKYIPVSGTVIIYFSKEKIDTQLGYGSQILFTKPLQCITNTGNPGGFDYNRFLLFQGITGQVFLKSGEYKILPEIEASSFQIFLNTTRRYVIQTLQTFIHGKDEQSVAEALLIGYRNDLDKQLVMSYSKTGVVHIIAISGLHLGMIYGFILLLFSRFKNRKWYRLVVPITALLILWLFTLLAGAVPSILRSAVTFSFIAIGMLINRKTNIYNTLAASAFCLLVFNPFMLWDVGFQLSYMAVLGIILFSKPIAGCFYFENKILNAVWQVACITLSAQILTLPVILYNFHQFPVLFLITNLIVVPLSEIILFALLFIVVASKWSLLAVFAGKLTQLLLWGMNVVIIHTARLPYSVIPNIKTDVTQACLLYVIIILLALWLLYRLPRFLLYGISMTVVLAIYTTVDIVKTGRQSKLIVYNISRHHAIDVVNGTKAYCFYDKDLLTDIQATTFYIVPCHTLLRINEWRYQSLSDTGNMCIDANGKTLLFINHSLPEFHKNVRLKADAVLITNQARLDINNLKQMFDCPLLIVDNNVPSYKIARWKRDCDSFHIQFHSLSQQGAFVIDL